MNGGLAVQVPPPTACMLKCPEPTASLKKQIGKPSITEVAGLCEQPFCVRLGGAVDGVSGVTHTHTYTDICTLANVCV